MTSKAQTGISQNERQKESRSLIAISIVALSMALTVATAVAIIIYMMIKNGGEDPIGPIIPIVQQADNSDKYIYMTVQELDNENKDMAPRIVKKDEELLEYISELAPLDYYGISRITGSAKPDYESNDYVVFVKLKDLYRESNYRIDTISADRDKVEINFQYDEVCNKEYEDMMQYDVYLVPIEKNLAMSNAEIKINYEVGKTGRKCDK